MSEFKGYLNNDQIISLTKRNDYEMYFDSKKMKKYSNLPFF